VVAVPGDERRGGPSPEPPPETPPPTKRETASIVTRDPAERLLELVGPYVQGVLADVDVITSKAAARAAEIPDRPELVRQVEAMWTVIGELLMRVAVLETDLQERDAERQRQRRRGRTGAA
jgi:hypothetical protein